jgi:hypothetical protein
VIAILVLLWHGDYNRIQNDFLNKVQQWTDRDLSAENLMKMYADGYRIDWKNYQNKVYDSIFIGDTDLKFIKS